MNASLKRFRVSVVTWDVYDCWISATDGFDAEEQALHQWLSGNKSSFTHRHGGFDGIEAEEVNS